MRILAAACLLAALSACTTVAPAQRKVDPDTLPACTRACEQVGMRLSAIVFVSEFGGCVCEPAPRTAAAASGTATGGLVTILAAQAAQQQQQQHQSAAGAAGGGYHR